MLSVWNVRLEDNNGRNIHSPPPTLLPLPTVAAYSCLVASQPSVQLGGLPPGLQRAKRGQVGVAPAERKDGLLARKVGPNARRAKLLGNRGFPGARSPAGSYARSLSLSPKSEEPEGHPPSRHADDHDDFMKLAFEPWELVRERRRVSDAASSGA